MGGRRKPSFYAVARGAKPGIYLDWESCKAQVFGYRASRFKGFHTREEAVAFIQENQVPDVIRDRGNRSKGAHDDVPSEAETKLKSKRLRDDAEQTTEGDLPHKIAKVKPQSSTEVAIYEAEAPVESDIEPLVIYTDGSARGNGTEDSVAGLGAFFGEDDPRNISERLPGTRQTNQRAELTAIIRALESVLYNTPVVIKTDSQYSINCFTTWSEVWCRNGWKNSNKTKVENRDLVEKGLALIKHRSASTRFFKVRAHIGIHGNEMADQLANEGAAKEPLFDLEPPFAP